MEYMICARFHALILSTIFRQKIYIMSYSKKIDNVNNDLLLNLPIVHFEDITDKKYIDLNDFGIVEEERIEKIVEHAKEQDLAVRNFIN